MNPAMPIVSASRNRKLSEILEPAHSWGSYGLYGESIPHLLHWDWAYLWVLKREGAKPQGWETKLDAWRRLVSMLLLGELQLEPKRIEQPLASYTNWINLQEVVFVKAPRYFFDVPIGVLSPTVLVRPLPEPNRFNVTAEQLVTRLPNHLDPPPTIGDRRRELAQMLVLVKRNIAESGTEYADELISLLDRSLRVSSSVSGHVTYPVMPLTSKVPLLKKADSSAWNDLDLVGITVLVPQANAAYQTHLVPQCERCRAPLTYSEMEPVVEVADNVRLTCRNCGAVSTFDLAQFGLWKDADVMYVWQELEQLEGLGQSPLPPRAEVGSDEVRFRWNPAVLGGENVRVHLRLKFPQFRLRTVKISEIKYPTLLVPGSLNADFRGSPIRPEWLFALEQYPEVEVVGEVISFRNTRIRGIPHTVTLGKYPKSACRIIPDLQLGIFPSPKYPSWKWYRLFWSGSNASDFEVRIVRIPSSAEIAKSTLAGTMDWHDTVPLAAALQSKAIGDLPAMVGTTWLLDQPREPEAAQSLQIGIDFGTTNTVVYAKTQDGKPVVLEQRDFVNTAAVIAGPSVEPKTSFLPFRASNEFSQTDPTLIPAALWFSERDPYNPIRWRAEAPSRSHAAVHGFKWGIQNDALRKQYLSELLFLTLPAVLKKVAPGASLKANWTIGFAYPLAFTDTQRAAYHYIFSDLRKRINAGTGGTTDITCINESYACVRAFGEHQHGSVFLIADLGGGSLDLALFELGSTSDGRTVPKHFQVGSAKIGGEAFVSALARRMAVDDESRDRQYWKIREAIMEGRVAHEFPGTNFGGVATRFLPIAQELLRIMLEAFRAQFANRQVFLVLVGNGWRIEEFTAATPLSESAARRELEAQFKRFEIASLSIYDERLEAPPKHVVAYGALKNAKPEGQYELQAATQDTKIPAGRDIKLSNTGTVIRWSDLVGPAVSNLIPGTGPGHIQIDRRSGPQAPDQWSQRLNFAIPNLDTVPSDAYVRDKLNISGERLEKGPLQIILEKRAEDLE